MDLRYVVKARGLLFQQAREYYIDEISEKFEEFYHILRVSMLLGESPRVMFNTSFYRNYFENFL